MESPTPPTSGAAETAHVRPATLPSALPPSTPARLPPARYLGPGLGVFLAFVALSTLLLVRSAVPASPSRPALPSGAPGPGPEGDRADDAQEEDVVADGGAGPLRAAAPPPDERAFGRPAEEGRGKQPAPAVGGPATAAAPPAPGAAPAAPTLPRGPTAATLAASLEELLTTMGEAGREPGQALATVEHVRRDLPAFDRELRQYRAVVRTGEARELADAFATRADQTRGLLQKAVVETNAAARQALEEGASEALRDPFTGAAGAVRSAQAALEGAKAAAEGAP